MPGNQPVSTLMAAQCLVCARQWRNIKPKQATYAQYQAAQAGECSPLGVPRLPGQRRRRWPQDGPGCFRDAGQCACARVGRRREDDR